MSTIRFRFAPDKAFAALHWILDTPGKPDIIEYLKENARFMKL